MTRARVTPRRRMPHQHPRHARRQRRRKVIKRKSLSLLIMTTAGFFIFASMTTLLGLRHLQALDHDLPSTDTPFTTLDLASVMVDRHGAELYRIVGEEAREPLDMASLPAHVKWSFLAAEDIDFYTHDGFDPEAIIRCGIKFVGTQGAEVCGGSTITQQLIKITSLGSDFNVERKLREVLMSVKVEQDHSKEEILEQYLNSAPMGANLYGLATGARFYFGKTPQELTLAESTLLAAIIQNPVALSPTVGIPDPTEAKRLAIQRQNYILDQLALHQEKINNQVRINADDLELDDLITPELIAEARATELVFQKPVYTNKLAGHFVDHALYLLTTRPYKNGTEPFTLDELRTGGYRITTTLDLEVQKVAERTVADAAAQYGPSYGLSNAAMLTMKPNTGEILAMMGSKSYVGQDEGCDGAGQNCRYNPQVNVLTTKQSPGSSTKPFAMYEAYRTGKLFTGSLLPDIPITLGNYRPKNWNGTFHGVSTRTNAGSMLCESRNLPAIITLELIGINRFTQVLREFGYTTYPEAGSYSYPVVLGGADVIGIEHAQAYGVFANGGSLVTYELIAKVVDRDGHTVYEHKPAPQYVADAKAVYMINHSLNNCYGSSWDGRNVAGKTGTSENSIDAWEVIWSPDFVTIGWAGNNNNQPMHYNAFGGTVVLPWLKGFMRQLGDSEYFAARSSFPRPAGLIDAGGRNLNGYQTGTVPGLMIQGLEPRADILHNKSGCTYYKMPAPHWQHFLDNYFKRAGRKNGC